MKYKKTEVEVYSEKVKKGRPDWGEQWDREAMKHLQQKGAEGDIEKYFSEYLRGTRCLIIGIGGGGDALRLKNTVEYLVGIDIAKPQLIKALRLKKSNNCEFMVCDAEFLPFRNNSFSSIVCRSTLHHISNWNVMLVQIFKVLKEKGVLILLEPGLLNPIAFMGRKFFPTNVHTSGERPFIPFFLKRQVELKFKVIKASYYYMFSHILPILYKSFGISNGLKKLSIIDYVYYLDELLLKTPLRQLCWSFIIVAEKSGVRND